MIADSNHDEVTIEMVSACGFLPAPQQLQASTKRLMKDRILRTSRRMRRAPATDRSQDN
jgi:hypothetical protein